MERASTKFILSEDERTQSDNDSWMYEDVLLEFILFDLLCFCIKYEFEINYILRSSLKFLSDFNIAYHIKKGT